MNNFDVQEAIYRGVESNPLVDALPALLTREQWAEEMTKAPFPDPSSCERSDEYRLEQIMGMDGLMLPLERNIDVAMALQIRLRLGLANRAPRTPEASRISRSLYEARQRGEFSSLHASTQPPLLSTSIIGIPGMGKSVTVNRFRDFFPKVIFHRKMNLYQIPVLKVDIPSSGASVKALCSEILSKMDMVVPDAGYHDLYFGTGRSSADTIMKRVAMLMHKHCVGILICDEVQNLENSKKGGKSLMSELVSACNELGLPIIFIGTFEATQVLSKDFREARRAVGTGVTQWTSLERGTDGNPGEFDVYMSFLWDYQVLRRKVELSEKLVSLFFELTNGIIDLTQNLFRAVQYHAIITGEEMITPEALRHVYQTKYGMIAPMITAMRSGDLSLLASYKDLLPDDQSLRLSMATKGTRDYTGRPFLLTKNDPGYASSLETAVLSMGTTQDHATEVVNAAMQSVPDSANLVQGMQAAVKVMKPSPRRNSRRTKTGSTISVVHSVMEPSHTQLADLVPLQ